MIGRLVEQQDVGLGRECAGQGGAARLPAGKLRRVLRTRQAKLFEQIARTVRIVAGLEARRDEAKYGDMAGEVGLLWQIADGRAGLHKPRPMVGFNQTGGDLQQCRFARAVTADQAHMLAFADRKLGAFEQRSAAKREMGILQGKKGRGHDLYLSSLPACGERSDRKAIRVRGFATARRALSRLALCAHHPLSQAGEGKQAILPHRTCSIPARRAPRSLPGPARRSPKW